MDTLIDLSWRLYPATVLMAIGLAVAAIGTLGEIDGIRRPVRDPVKVLTFARGFRLAIFGLAFAGIGAAWAWHLLWLLVLALVIGGEEILESSIVIFALTRGRHLRIRFPA